MQVGTTFSSFSTDVMQNPNDGNTCKSDTERQGGCIIELGVPAGGTGTTVGTSEAITGWVPTFAGDCAPDGTLSIKKAHAMACSLTNVLPDVGSADPTAAITVDAAWADRTGADLHPTTITVLDSNSATVAQFSTDQMFSKADGSPCTTQAARQAGCEIEVGVVAATGGSGFTVTDTSADYVPTLSGDCSHSGSVSVKQHQLRACTVTSIRSQIGSAKPNAILTLTNTWVDRKLLLFQAATITVVDPNKGIVASFSTDSMFSLSDGSPCTTVPAREAGCAVDIGVIGDPSGSFTVSETAPSGMVATLTGGCTFDAHVSVEPGELSTCQVVDTRPDKGSNAPTGMLSVTQSWLDRSGQLLQAASVTVKDASSATVATFSTNQMTSMAGGSCTSEVKRQAGCVLGVGVVVANGPFTVTETPATGQVASFDELCDFSGTVTVSAGEDALCAVTDTRPLVGSPSPTAVIEFAQTWVDRTTSRPQPQAATVTVRDQSQAVVATFSTDAMRTATKGQCNTATRRSGGCFIEIGIASPTGNPFSITETVVSGQVDTFGGDCLNSGQIVVARGQTASCSGADTKTVTGSTGATSVLELSHTWVEHVGVTLPSATITVQDNLFHQVASFSTNVLQSTLGAACTSETDRRAGCLGDIAVVGTNGPFAVKETPPSGWIVTFGPECTGGSVPLGQNHATVTCGIKLVRF